jgi:hypothetical protein
MKISIVVYSKEISRKCKIGELDIISTLITGAFRIGVGVIVL